MNNKNLKILKKHKVSGFTLLEVIVATVIFAIVVIGTGSLSVAAHRHVAEIGKRRSAMATANNLMERLEAYPALYMGYDTQSYNTTRYYKLTSSSTGISVYSKPYAYDLAAINGNVFTATLSGVKRKTKTAGGLTYDYLELEVVVAWGADSSQTFQISAIRSETSK